MSLIINEVEEYQVVGSADDQNLKFLQIKCADGTEVTIELHMDADSTEKNKVIMIDDKYAKAKMVTGKDLDLRKALSDTFVRYDRFI